MSDPVVFVIFLIFTGAALFATAALYARQALPVAYIALGVVVGPSVLGWVDHPALISEMAEIGIIFLLFLLGLNLLPQKLLQLFRETTVVTVFSALVFALAGFAVATMAGFDGIDSLLIAVSCCFSSTIIGLKLLPTTVLHHRHTGEIIISILLLQDLIAIVVLLLCQGSGEDQSTWLIIRSLLALPLVAGVAFVAERKILIPLLLKFDRISEYVFLLAIGWCLGLAQLSHALGLSHEIGAFIAGVAVATSPIARHIAEKLKPLRDFFLVMFFFALGAEFDVVASTAILLPGFILAALMLSLKPVVFRFLLTRAAETNKLAWETGFRLGQLSEFSLLIVFVALHNGLMSESAGTLVQLATVLTLIGSSYLIVFRYPTPVAVSDRLRRD